MKAKIGRGKGLKGLLAYAFEGHKDGTIEKGARLIGGTCSGSSLAEIQAEFTALRKVRPDIERPAWHCSLSLKPPETLTDEQWSQVAEKYMRGMGFSDKSLYVVVRHTDTEHDHIHVIASRIGLDGKIYLGQKEAARSMPLTNQIAKEFGLSELAHDTRAEVKGITAGEKSMMDRTGEIPTRIILQTYIDDAVKGKPSFAEFVAKLEAQGVKIIPLGKTGQAKGMTFELNGIPFTGTKLGDKFKWKPLQAQLDYLPERDQPVLDRLRAQAARPETTGELTNLTIDIPETANDHNQRTYFTHTAKPHPGNFRYPAENGMRKLSECGLAHSGDQREKREGVLLIDVLPNRRSVEQLRWAEPATRTNNGNRTLDIAFEQTESGVYKWKSRGTVAITDHGDRISVHSKAESAVRGSLQLAKEKGWKSIEATGSDEFRKKSWLIGNELGLSVSGYEPTEADREELKQRLADKEAKYGKNSRMAEGGGRSSKRYQDDSRAVSSGATASHRPEFDSRTGGSSDMASPRGEEAVRQHAREAIEIPTTSRRIADSAAVADDNVHGNSRHNLDTVRASVNYVSAISAVISNKRAGSADAKKRRNSVPSDYTQKVAAQKLRDAERQRALESDRAKQQAGHEKETQQERDDRLAKIEGREQITGDAVTLAYRREVKKVVGLARQKGWTLDWSRVDYAATKELLKSGYKPDLIEKAIVEASPGLAGRHSDAKRYASDTVRHAAVDKDVLRYTERAQRASGSDRLER